MGKNWYKEKKKEAWYRKAKREGFRARSAYKLQQIQERHRVVRAGDTVIDLGAAPGGWSQVAVGLVGPKGRVVGVDLQGVPPLEGARFLRGDFTKSETVEALFQLLASEPRGVRVDVVLSDMSPQLTGNYTMDQANSVYLCQHALGFARRVLDAGGRLVVKVFEGEDYPEFLKDVRGSFGSVKPYRPPASRKQSSELYLVAMAFRPPRSASPGTIGSPPAARPS